ncbi:MAG TPA: addiction module protein, partial [Verrucomicrobiota bacterium]|nr:addiction module protein [Verrucomicrobiota bacterium]
FRAVSHRMEAALPLEHMSVEEKLRAMDALWADLSRVEVAYESPPWHGEVLRERAAASEACLDWEAAKEELRRRR